MKAFAAISMISLLASQVLAETVALSFDRYEGILVRKPFGDLPPPVTPPAPPPPKPPEIPKSYRLCSIVQEDDGTLKVGLIDLRTQKAVVLSPGGPAENGLQVLEASYDKETATLQLGDEVQILELKSGTATQVTPGQTAPAAPALAAPPTTHMTPPPQPPSPGMSYAERRRQRLLEQQEPPAAPQPKYTGQALQKHLQDYQMEVIRQGLPPLPIPLTPEQDSQLVKEGVLPPQPAPAQQ